MTAPESAIARIEDRRRAVSRAVERAQRAELGQFFTPADIAGFMASLLDFSRDGDVHLLDPGAGIGSLTAAAAARVGDRAARVTCYEIDARFIPELESTIACLANVEGVIENRDFIEHAVMRAAATKKAGYTHVILNPPYKKIAVSSAHRQLVRKLGLETTNLYACFLACSVALCRPGAQIVAILPRSFMNGPYFKAFRYWLLDRVALTHIHVFERRDAAFGDDSVLQENVIVRVVVGDRQAGVQVTSSKDQALADCRKRLCTFDEIVALDDAERFIHVPTAESVASNGLPGETLQDLGLEVCTGPVVDFRLREHLAAVPLPGTVPLIYATHFQGGNLVWPREGKKPNAIRRNPETEKWLMPNGCYVVLRRFTSKEEKRRVVAYVLAPGSLPGAMIGFENHLNVIHHKRRGLDPVIARGLAHYLNSKEVDDYFRVFSGHTQVNATDLRRLRFPDLAKLRRLGAS